MRTGGSVPNFKAPGRKWPSARMWATAALCLVLPPVGLILLWGGAKCPLRGKLSLSLLSLLSMIGILTLVMGWNDRLSATVPQPTVSYQYAQPQAQPAQAAATEAPRTSAEPAELPEGVIPANPMG